MVLQRLRDKQLFAKRSKCSFFCSEVEFLGHYVGRDGLRMVESKVASVENWPTPTCQGDVEQFLGLAGYYRPFIRDLSKIAAPLAALTGRLRKGKGVRPAGGGKPTHTPRKAWHWGEREEASFGAVKSAITRAPCLAIADPSQPYVVHTDASGYATGAVLMQDQGRGLQPIALMSKKMLDAETRYPVHEQELLAIIHALGSWRHYLHQCAHVHRNSRRVTPGTTTAIKASVTPHINRFASSWILATLALRVNSSLFSMRAI